MAKLNEGSVIKKTAGHEIIATIPDVSVKADKTYVDTELGKKVTELAKKVDKVTGKELSTNDYTTAEKNKLSGIATGAQVNTVTSVSGKTGAVTLTKSDVGLGSVQNYDIATQTEANAGTSDAKYMTPLKTLGVVDAKIALSNSASKTDLTNHTDNVANPHGVTKSQVGLSTVQNYSVATQSESEAGTSDAKYMTPLKTKQAITSIQAVKSVAGRTGAVVVNKSDVGLSNVDNLSASSIRGGITKDDVGLSNVDNVKQMPINGGVLENYKEKLITVPASVGGVPLDLGNVFQHTPSANRTYMFFSDVASEQAYSFTLIINMGSTVRTLTFPTSVKWRGGEMPDMSTANKTYVLTFMSVDVGTTWLGMFEGEF